VSQDSYTNTGSPLSTAWLLIICAIGIFEIASMWKVFTKAGKPGWASIIPIYNAFVILDIAGRPLWWFLLYLIPGVNIIIACIVMHDISKSFGHDIGFTLGLILLGGIFIPILAWGDSHYLGPAAGTPVPA